MPESAEAVSKRNAEVVRRYLRVFETKDIAEFEELLAEDVLVHGAGFHGQGRRCPEGAALTPGLSNCLTARSTSSTSSGLCRRD